MKKLVVFLLPVVLLYACERYDNNTSISYRDKGDFYSMEARFSKRKTNRAVWYMNEKIGKENNISFNNTSTDGLITLNNGTTFYLKKNPGHILIKMNKSENSGQAVHDMKIMCEGMKSVLLNENR